MDNTPKPLLGGVTPPKTVSEESAKAQVQIFLDYYELEAKDIEVENGTEAVNTMINGMVKAVKKGRLEILEGGPDGFQVVQYLAHPVQNVEVIRFSDKVGVADVATDNAVKPQQKRMEFLSALTGLEPSVLMNLKGGDTTTFKRVATIFSMV